MHYCTLCQKLQNKTADLKERAQPIYFLKDLSKYVLETIILKGLQPIVQHLQPSLS